MNILDHLDKLRAKPVHVRQRIALFSTFILSFLVASVWWATWNTESQPETLSSSSASSIISPWGVVTDMISDAKKDTMAAVGQLTGQLQRAAEDNIEYDPTLEGESGAETSEDSRNEAFAPYDLDASSSEVSGESTPSDASSGGNSGEMIRTRPGTYQTAVPSELVPKTDVVE
ncbi:MAG: hypothetical protein A2942_01240 [Candidatus Lloydbacteria bacterium RIFCSPLOWO2_01_FULL_50_20]|uniref:Uncharacterized protein n=1 Tax=Candidatus Lloydbacteria bacterium RIFCSPLOWO2_01_FULL_50_20 TaxID=1798665 RepID=A0A1G2DKG4_9BACT|nr:MAG: hypothetical protein A3C13_00785 [Candidatus Lloydbacteria bacterium RIFCSPHIGHO2_02_FULL_50_11]OGZ13451.1 MAG: hypothetical protein A2942_01240 [Candidatus Lloydbacteria bacterium RIFCSPLOWO2_01_FULL_50_20]